MDHRPTTWLPDSPFRSPAWRWERANWLHDHGGRTDRRIDDAWVARARDFLAARGRQAEARPSRRHRAHDPHIQAALDLWRADPPAPRWRLEARLLTGAPLDEVTRLCDLSVEVIETFHQLFFEVRPRLRATDWVMFHAVGTYYAKGFAGLPVGSLWKWAAYTAGPRALEVVMALTTDAPLPTWVRDGLAGGVYAENRFRLMGNLTLRAMAADSPAEWDALVRARQQLRRLDREVEGACEGPTGMLRAMERSLCTRSRRRRTGRPSCGDSTRCERSGGRGSETCAAGLRQRQAAGMPAHGRPAPTQGRPSSRGVSAPRAG
jgi:hypothetical protein